ncbi:hypothetical protein SBRCBS47491_001803 [Sporothrix bragantina]|uniref:Rhodopsin domain-containing protein n=1 Tax=Sporothrix bragantina TaxID=671064 RepID=A0ABP0B2A7_9PEZI
MQFKEKLGVLVAMSMGILAGIVAFIKCSKIPETASSDMFDTAQLMIWDDAEVSVTIIAASIPALRLLIREANLSARQYYGGGTHGTNHSQSRKATSRRATVVESARTGDDHSDKSILDAPGAGEIYYRTDVTVEHSNKSRYDGFELAERAV